MPIRLLRRPTDTASGRLLVAVGAGGPSLFAAKREKTFSSIFPPRPIPSPARFRSVPPLKKRERETAAQRRPSKTTRKSTFFCMKRHAVWYERQSVPDGERLEWTAQRSNGSRRATKRAGESPPVSSLFWRRDQPRFISSMSCESCCVWWARSETACAASFMAWADWEDMSLTSRMDRLISSLAADCSSLAAAMALT